MSTIFKFPSRYTVLIIACVTIATIKLAIGSYSPAPLQYFNYILKQREADLDDYEAICIKDDKQGGAVLWRFKKASNQNEWNMFIFAHGNDGHYGFASMYGIVNFENHPTDREIQETLKFQFKGISD